jgi:hypothetical protein
MAKSPPDICPVCGEEVPRKARACPGCGADHNSGWNEDFNPHLAGASIPDQDFDYDEFVDRELLGQNKPVKPKGIHPFWWITAIVLLLLLLFGFIKGWS